MMSKPRVAVICTVLNEEKSVASLLTSLEAQTVRPDEVVIVDGGSTDRTVTIVKEHAARGQPIRCLVAPGSNISAGRNLAIKSTAAEIIASTDAGVRLSERWLENLVRPFSPADGCDPADVVSGFFRSDPHSLFEAAMGATVLPAESDIKVDAFLPSSRSVAFRRSAWQAVGGYPEWLDYCEDIVFDLALRRAGFHFAFAGGAVAAFRPRGNLGAFFRQYYRYARGDGKAGLWRRRHIIRYGSYALGALALLFGFWYKVAWFAAVCAGLAYVYHPYRRLLPALRPYGTADRLKAVLLVPVIRLVGDLAKMAGYPAGLAWRHGRGGRRA